MVHPRLLLILLQLTLALPVLGQDYYVAPGGGDGNPGSLELPFATLQRAQQAVRQQPGAVWLRGGTYSLSETLVFSAAPSLSIKGQARTAAPVVYQAYGQEQPALLFDKGRVFDK